ncbi:helix-turn-helix domain-containing protein [Streptacidiphilus melanogenes]|uniref:helix-turn-helix domain-containing protein n=1 Tax=Streptacidiphilus melanogenes TaxID=411235 RepID=UPI0007C85CE4|nr:helix-turn-helix domain-containing protein [Streptacidiphilus melanogenes]
MELTDPKAIRALAHPLRLDLLELLTATGPATAAHCGRVLGQTQASCSFHLRQLAKYGFVEDAGPGRDRRERKWQVPEPRPTLRIRGAGKELERLVVEREAAAILDWLERKPQETGAWRDRSDIVSALAVLTVEEAAGLKARMHELIEPYLLRSGDDARLLHPDRRAVRYFMAATPMPLLETGGTEDGQTDD